MGKLVRWMAWLTVLAAAAAVVPGIAVWREQRISQASVAAWAGTVTVAVDPGHGGADGGAVGSLSGVPEAGLNLAVAAEVARLLSQAGVNVVMTRTGDAALADTKQADMQARGRILSQPQMDLVVSIHMNKFTDPGVHGAMAYYMQGSERGRALAQCVIDALTAALGQNSRLANPGDYFVLRECAAPAVIVECGFLSNPQEEQLLLDGDYQRKLARGVADGVLAYLEGGGGETEG